MDRRPNRRSILSALGAAGNASLAGLTVAESGSQKNESRSDGSSDREVVEWTEGKQTKFTGTALNNTKVKAIARRLEQNGWTVSDGEHRPGTVLADGGKKYDFGVLPFEMEAESDRQAAILWKRYKTGGWEVKGYVYSNSDGKSDKEGVITVDSVMNARKKEYEEEGTIETSCPCLDPGGGSDCVYFHDEYCDDFNLSCITWVIAAAGLSCASLNPINCLIGSGLALAPYLSDDGCDICDEYAEQDVVLC